MTKKAARGSAGAANSRGRRVFCPYGERRSVRVMEITKIFQNSFFCISATLFLFYGAIF